MLRRAVYVVLSKDSYRYLSRDYSTFFPGIPLENFLGISSGISGLITPGVSAEIPSKFLPMDSVRAFSRDSSMKFFTNFYRDSSSNHTKSRVQH